MLGILREQKGSIIVPAALSLICLMGFSALVVDVGALYQNRVQLINTADAAALAGARDLPGDPEEAVSAANNYARLNGKPGDQVTPVVENDNTSVTVTASRTVNLFFARVLGFNSTNVSARATATVSGVAGYTGAAPFGVVQNAWVLGQEVNLRVGSGNSQRGNFGPLALGGTGASVYGDNILHGYHGTIYVNQKVDTETGDINGPTREAVQQLIDADPDATVETVSPNSPRVVIVPIIDTLNVKGGSTQVTVVGFAAFFLKSVDGGVVTGQFLRLVTNGNGVAGNATDFGLTTIQLTK